MKFQSIVHPEPGATKPEVADNSWYRQSAERTVLVFVHGVLSSAAECWFNKKKNIFWPNLVKNDATFNDCAIFLGGYFTEAAAGNYGIHDCAIDLSSALARQIGGRPAVLEYERIVFVCHSLGGVITRYMLEWAREEFGPKSVCLLLIASPSMGSRWANLVWRFTWMLRNRTLNQLRWRSSDIQSLDRKFMALREKELIPKMIGFEACEQKLAFVPKYFPWIPPIVGVESCGRYFTYQIIPHTDHSSVVKPASDSADIHQWLRDCYQKFNKKFPVTAPLPAALATAGPHVPAGGTLRREGLSFAMRIDADGGELTHDQQALLEIRRRELVSVRRLFGSSQLADEQLKQKEGILRALAEFGGFVVELIVNAILPMGGPRAPHMAAELVQTLEIGLMAVDVGGNESLKFVAGTHVGTPAYWDMELPLGEGIAGRAAIRLEARVYDDLRAKGTDAYLAYVELEPGKRHQWLLAIPLWEEASGRKAIGVINVSTYDPSVALILRALDQSDRITALVNRANGDVLPRVWKLVS